MYSFLLKKALPFTLTFVFGAALSGLVGLFGGPEKKYEYVGTRTYDYGGRCRMRRHNLVAETKPLNILNVPAADLIGTPGENIYTYPVSVDVTFGAGGKVLKVEPLGSWQGHERDETTQAVWEAVERAARQIEFEPETVNGLGVVVTRRVDIPVTRCNMMHLGGD